MEQTAGLEVDILRLLRASGYAGAGTATVPSHWLMTELESFRDTSVPAAGAGVGIGTAGA